MNQILNQNKTKLMSIYFGYFLFLSLSIKLANEKKLKNFKKHINRKLFLFSRQNLLILKSFKFKTKRIMSSYELSPSTISIPAQTSFVGNSGSGISVPNHALSQSASSIQVQTSFVGNSGSGISVPSQPSFNGASAPIIYSSAPNGSFINSQTMIAPASISHNGQSGITLANGSATSIIGNGPILAQTAPIRTVEEIRGTRTIKVPVQRQVRTQVPVQKAIKTQVPVQRAIHGTQDVVSHVTVNHPKVEVFTRMVPVQEKRVVNVPSVEKRVTKVPTVNYVTEMQEKINYVTEMEERVNTVTEYETRTIPTVQRRIRTRYETVQDLPIQDDAQVSSFSASNGISAINLNTSSAQFAPNTAPTLNVLSNTSGSAALYSPTFNSNF